MEKNARSNHFEPHEHKRTEMEPLILLGVILITAAREWLELQLLYSALFQLEYNYQDGVVNIFAEGPRVGPGWIRVVHVFIHA